MLEWAIATAIPTNPAFAEAYEDDHIGGLSFLPFRGRVDL